MKNSKRAVGDGKREKAGAFLPFFPLPIVPPRAFLLSSPQPPNDTKRIWPLGRESHTPKVREGQGKRYLRDNIRNNFGHAVHNTFISSLISKEMVRNFSHFDKYFPTGILLLLFAQGRPGKEWTNPLGLKD